MARKHFVKAAQYISSLKGSIAEDTRYWMARLIVEIQDNPNFDSRRFYTACGVEVPS